MSLFFYGALQVKGLRHEAAAQLQHEAQMLGWTLTFDDLTKEYSIDELFGIPQQHADATLVFELKGGPDEVYTLLYDDYGGEWMVQRYREIARDLGIAEWESMDFGSNESVDEAYAGRPVDLPLIVFLRTLLQNHPEQQIIVCIDEGFENRFDCETIAGDIAVLLRAAWSTIAFGYTWPNLRLCFNPQVNG